MTISLLLGLVKVWDFRVGDTPVAVIGPPEGERTVDPWSVCFGNSFNDTGFKFISAH